jgi:hypothetical protein
MFLGPDDVGNRHVVIIHGACQVVQTGTVGTLDDVILLLGPIELHLSTDEVSKPAASFSGHFESYDCAATLRLEPGLVLSACGHPATAVDKPALLGLSDLSLLFELLRGGKVTVGAAVGNELSDGVGMAVVPLRLEIGTVVATNLGSLVPIEPQPPKSVENRLQSLVEIPLLIGVVDPQDELTSVMTAE